MLRTLIILSTGIMLAWLAWRWMTVAWFRPEELSTWARGESDDAVWMKPYVESDWFVPVNQIAALIVWSLGLSIAIATFYWMMVVLLQ
jgi:hypothetical protein